MDIAVALVQAYLHVNGYFTVAEYPVMEASGVGPARSITDLDILAFRFAGAGHRVVRRGGDESEVPRTDPLLRCPPDHPDMIVGEVKEGAARFNAAMRNPAVLGVALARFGCCSPEHVGHATQQLLSKGAAVMPSGHSIRMIAFGDTPERQQPGIVISMRHVVEYVQTYLRDNWPVLRHTQIRDPALGLLALIEKWGRTPDGGRDRRPSRRRR
ncbi:MAG: hypothetical protein K2Y23_25350 [Cyanobacteria bacterium]|nr:hypothetical protein [Cyanobacteriota bacterium]